MRTNYGRAFCIAIITTLLQVTYGEGVDCSANNYTCDFLLVSASGSGPEGDDGQGFFDGVYSYVEEKGYFTMETVWINDTVKTCYLSVYDSGSAKYWVFGTAQPNSSSIDYANTYGFADYQYDSPVTGGKESITCPQDIPGSSWSGKNVQGAMISCRPTPPPPSPPFDAPPEEVVTSQKQFDCPTGYTNDARSWTGTWCSRTCDCSWWENNCNFCCKRSGMSCFRSDPIYPAPTPSSPTASWGWTQSCSWSCKRKKGNKECNGECNNPDCDFDGGDCCKQSKGEAKSSAPLVCQDPRYSLNDDGMESWRVDYHHSQCRRAPRDQGNCGSCYAFAAVTSQTKQMCMKGISNWQHELSPQYIESCYTANMQGPVQYGKANCEGGWLAYTLASLTDLGYRSEACYPYQYGGNSRNHFSGSGTKWKSCSTVYNQRSSSCSSQNFKVTSDERRRWGTIALDGTDATFNRVKAILREVGSAPLSFTVFENFFDWNFQYGPAKNPYGNSASDFNSQESGGHAVVIVGYGEYKVGSQKRRYFTVENSWGNKNNDDNGHFYIVADRDMAKTPFNGRVTFLDEELKTALKTAPARHRRHLQEVLDANKLEEEDWQADEVDVSEDLVGSRNVTNCDRTNVQSAIQAATAVIQSYVLENHGKNVSVEVTDTNLCESQVVNGDNIRVSATIAVDSVKQKYTINAVRVTQPQCMEFFEDSNESVPLECVDRSTVYELTNYTEDWAEGLVGMGAVTGVYTVRVDEDNGKHAGSGDVPYVQKDQEVIIYANNTVLHGDSSASSGEEESSEEDDEDKEMGFGLVYGAVLAALVTAMLFGFCGMYFMRQKGSPRYFEVKDATSGQNPMYKPHTSVLMSDAVNGGSGSPL